MLLGGASELIDRKSNGWHKLSHRAGCSRVSNPVSRGETMNRWFDGLPEVHGDSVGCGWPGH
jgi:hypothetical protein